MIRRLVGAVVLLLGVFALVGPAAPASAGGGSSDYADCTVQVAPPQFAAGRMVTVIGRGFEPNFLTTIFLDDVIVLGTVTTNAQGFFQTRVLIPEGTEEGPHTIGALCDATGNISNTDVEVSSSGATRSPAESAAALARTGSNSTEPLVVAGGLALLAGVAFVVVARRRRRSHVGV